MPSKVIRYADGVAKCTKHFVVKSEKKKRQKLREGERERGGYVYPMDVHYS